MGLALQGRILSGVGMGREEATHLIGWAGGVGGSGLEKRPVANH